MISSLANELAQAESAAPFNSQVLSESSTKTVPESLWFSSDMVLGAGAVIIQPSSGKVVLVSRKYKRKDEKGQDFEGEEYFLPKGRKDLGETLEQAALREAYEESGYRCTFLPLNIPTHAPSSLEATTANTPRYPNTEPFYVNISHSPQVPRDPLFPSENGTQYLAFWYMAQISQDAVPEKNTQMADEEGYQTHLLSFDEAEEKMKTCLRCSYRCVLKKARQLWESGNNGVATL